MSSQTNTNDGLPTYEEAVGMCSNIDSTIQNYGIRNENHVLPVNSGETSIVIPQNTENGLLDTDTESYCLDDDFQITQRCAKLCEDCCVFCGKILRNIFLFLYFSFLWYIFMI
ncbi:hypothetical protein EDEG_01175 [Edhazardia aedis USNM 41457]|uniref:Uncharacterized protein n=1 Tax=Edhazardia aedis (strain USNM 41457) TaxID=1003232 RepID=J8ZYA8_EDHAE|nr:hypothetical protein EDEG_01175 [Edhazardia aedis USNM 41457]|eukprot:EJW04623.1 hypothetical protein EDEG_01175 [Edhazardia aedis USNM 41457]